MAWYVAATGGKISSQRARFNVKVSPAAPLHRFALYYRVGTRWVRYGSSYMNLDLTGAGVAMYRTTSAGTKYIRITVPGDSTHVAGNSRIFRITFP